MKYSDERYLHLVYLFTGVMYDSVKNVPEINLQFQCFSHGYFIFAKGEMKGEVYVVMIIPRYEEMIFPDETLEDLVYNKKALNILYAKAFNDTIIDSKVIYRAPQSVFDQLKKG